MNPPLGFLPCKVQVHLLPYTKSLSLDSLPLGSAQWALGPPVGSREIGHGVLGLSRTHWASNQSYDTSCYPGPWTGKNFQSICPARFLGSSWWYWGETGGQQCQMSGLSLSKLPHCPQQAGLPWEAAQLVWNLVWWAEIWGPCEKGATHTSFEALIENSSGQNWLGWAMVEMYSKETSTESQSPPSFP
jgi:hypothetical protein